MRVSVMPKAYVIAAETISDEAGFAQYRSAVPPSGGIKVVWRRCQRGASGRKP